MNLNEVSSKAHQDLCDLCLRNPHYLVLHKKTVSRLVAFLLLSSFFIFVAGYFLGKKQLAEDFSHVAEHASFADQINFALTSLYDKELRTPKTQELSMVEDNEAVDVQESPNLKNQQLSSSIVAEDLVKQKPFNQKKWLAQLFGGTQKEVTEFSNRLSRQGITVEVRKRFGKTARGKKIHWYQAVTQPHDNESELNALVARIKKLENIKISSDTIIPITT